jgi:hypothetical protein
MKGEGVQMGTSSVSSNESARKFHSLALQRIQSVGQKHVAEQLETSEATISRFVSGELERACQVLAAAGLKVVPIDAQCIPARKAEILLELARERLNQLESVDQLAVWRRA